MLCHRCCHRRWEAASLLQAAQAMVVACFPAGASAIRAGRVFSLRRAADLAAIVNQAIGGAPVRPRAAAVCHSSCWACL